MLKISKLSDYATTVMARMAALEAPSSAASLAQETQLTQTTVAKVLKVLSKAGLVHATRGASGGYQLARAANEITVADILCAIEGPLALTDCTELHGRCDRAGFCGTKSHWQTINAAILSALRAIHLSQLAQRRPNQIWLPVKAIARPTGALAPNATKEITV